MHAYTGLWQLRSPPEGDTIPLHCLAWPWSARLCHSNPGIPHEGEIPAWLNKRSSAGPLQVHKLCFVIVIEIQYNCTKDTCAYVPVLWPIPKMKTMWKNHPSTLMYTHTQCWCGSHWNTHHHWQCSWAGGEGGRGGHCHDCQQVTTAEAHDGSDRSTYVCVTVSLIVYLPLHHHWWFVIMCSSSCYHWCLSILLELLSVILIWQPKCSLAATVTVCVYGCGL